LSQTDTLKERKTVKKKKECTKEKGARNRKKQEISKRRTDRRAQQAKLYIRLRAFFEKNDFAISLGIFSHIYSLGAAFC
jgi:hypothetical protein